MLLKSVDDIILYLGRAVMSATTDDFIKPYIQAAQEDILVKAIGREIVTEFDNLYNSPSWNSGTTTTQQTELLHKMQRALAWYAYSKYLPFAIGNDGDNGLQEIGTDSTKPVRIGVLDKRTRETEKNAHDALENLLVFLAANSSYYPTYANSNSFQNAKSLFVPSAIELTVFLPFVRENYGFFLSFLPYLKLAERDYILPMLGQLQFDSLKSKSHSSYNSQEKELLWNVQRALAHAAYAEALPNLNVVLMSNGNLRVLSDFDGIYNRKSVDTNHLEAAALQAKTNAKKWLNVLRSFLSQHKSDYPLYEASNASKKTTQNRLPDNSKYQKTFRMK